MANTFDPDAFMQTHVDAPMADTYVLCPEGDHKAMIDDFDSGAFEQIDFEYKRGERKGEPGSMTKFTCPFVIQDPAVAQKMGVEKVVVRKQLIIDLDENGGLATGVNKNVGLGEIRAAVGQNNAGWSFPNLRGAGPVIVRVKHRAFNKDEPDRKVAEVVRVSALR